MVSDDITEYWEKRLTEARHAWSEANDTLIRDREEAYERAERSIDRINVLTGALESMVIQFAYWSTQAGGYITGGLSALEDAFDALGWDDPQPYPRHRCDEPGCMKQADCGWPTQSGYRHTCGDHWKKEE